MHGSLPRKATACSHQDGAVGMATRAVDAPEHVYVAIGSGQPHVLSRNRKPLPQPSRRPNLLGEGSGGKPPRDSRGSRRGPDQRSHMSTDDHTLVSEHCGPEPCELDDDDDELNKFKCDTQVSSWGRSNSSIRNGGRVQAAERKLGTGGSVGSGIRTEELAPSALNIYKSSTFLCRF